MNKSDIISMRKEVEQKVKKKFTSDYGGFQNELLPKQFPYLVGIKKKRRNYD